ncbi:MAG: hypothetical protein ACOX6T_10040, partial [Myxococcales bacterium]
MKMTQPWSSLAAFANFAEDHGFARACVKSARYLARNLVRVVSSEASLEMLDRKQPESAQSKGAGDEQLPGESAPSSYRTHQEAQEAYCRAYVSSLLKSSRGAVR